MAVFPEKMERINTANVERSLSVIEQYIRYMCERTEFTVSNLNKSLTKTNDEIGDGDTPGTILYRLDQLES